MAGNRLTLVVRSHEDLRLMLASDEAQKTFAMPQMSIRSDRLSLAEAQWWESRLESYRNACGCREGAVGLCVFIGFFIAYVSTADLSGLLGASFGAFALFAAFIAGLVACAAIGKAIGLRMAAIRFRQVCLQLNKRLEALES
jgi:hypothetical protein